MKKPSQKKLSRKLGLSQSYTNQILTGAKPMTYRLAYKWSKAFGKDMDWWLHSPPSQIETYLFQIFPEEKGTE